ncbi:hypothetical protein V500_06505 [Pseudogymnoascus sp. VKM F-4518 (FW-2643)]|nr:hypothetical protein V500_06505 [Pseudogymnoascus sp. VKM F-4518 (FW-2643)]
MYLKALLGYEKVVGPNHPMAQSLQEILQDLDSGTEKEAMKGIKEPVSNPREEVSRLGSEGAPSTSRRHKLFKKLGLRVSATARGLTRVPPLIIRGAVDLWHVPVPQVFRFFRLRVAREQLLKHAIQPQYLDPLWTLILETINENPGFHRFRGATLFSNAKNTKLEFNSKSLTQAYKDRTYVDLAKQATSEDSAMPYDQIPKDHEAEHPKGLKPEMG